MPPIRSIVEFAVIGCAVLLFFGSEKLQALLGIRRDTTDTSASRSSHNVEAPRSLTFVNESLICPTRPMNVQIFSNNPLIVYISDFINAAEAEELVDLAYVDISICDDISLLTNACNSEPYYEPSTVHSNGELLDPSVRRSERGQSSSVLSAQYNLCVLTRQHHCRVHHSCSA